MAKLCLWTFAHPELFRIKTLQQLGKHSHGPNQHCFAGFNSLQNSNSFGHRSFQANRTFNSRLNSNKGTKTLTGLSPKAFEQAFGSLRRCGTAVFVGLPAACSWFFGSVIWVHLFERAASLAGKTDHEVRRFAIETDRILVALDADFYNLIRFSPAGTPDT
jgi:hypothetical protein